LAPARKCPCLIIIISSSSSSSSSSIHSRLTCALSQACACFSSGMAAVNAAVQAFPGAYVLLADDCYHGVRTLFLT
jgi:cystathionine beta-lyase/cystathionine gamma-synthase